MAKFLTTAGISSEITNIIRDAESQITLITPYLKLSDKLFERLKDADRRSKKIKLVYGKDELKPDEKSKLDQLNNLLLYFSKDLHAKCYYNEELMVIASMNLHEYSEQNNWEIGLLINKEEDNKLFDEALKEIEIIINSAKPIKSRSSAIEKFGKGIIKVGKSVSDSLMEDDSRTQGRTRTASRTKHEGFCIRCRTSITYNPEKPLCPDCFSEWNIYKNPDYEEYCCHTCGRAYPTTIEKPLCDSCYYRQ